MLEEGVFLEVIALPCAPSRYSMPLGVLRYGGLGFFRVYPGAGLGRFLERGLDCILLLAPARPEVFLDSLRHRLEERLEWRGLPLPDPSLGSWFSCSCVNRIGGAGDGEWYSCRLRLVSGGPWAYSRVYGCVVELLVHATKAAAGAEVFDAGFTERLISCVRRSARGDPERARRLEMALRGLLEDMLEGGPR